MKTVFKTKISQNLERFYAVREREGISLEDVVKDTEIPRRHLMAIESGSIDELRGKPLLDVLSRNI